jgi:hypothetical protein
LGDWVAFQVESFQSFEIEKRADVGYLVCVQKEQFQVPELGKRADVGNLVIR